MISCPDATDVPPLVLAGSQEPAIYCSPSATAQRPLRRRSSERRWCGSRLGRVADYTHAWMDVPIAAWKGARVMASCETLEQVLEAAEMGYAAAIVVPEYLNAHRAYPAGNVRIVPCPYETKGVTCDKCRLCMRPENLKATGAVIASHMRRWRSARAKSSEWQT